MKLCLILASNGIATTSRNMRDTWLIEKFEKMAIPKNTLTEAEVIKLCRQLCDRLLVNRIKQKIRVKRDTKSEEFFYYFDFIGT